MTTLTIHMGAEPLSWMLEEHGRLERELGPIDWSTGQGDVADDTLLTLRRAVTLAELQGTITVKGLRRAIAAGELVASQPGGPNGIVYVTRADISSGFLNGNAQAAKALVSTSILRPRDQQAPQARHMGHRRWANDARPWNRP